MARIDTLKTHRMKNIHEIEILDKKRIKITFKNNAEPLTIEAQSEDFGYDAALYVVTKL